MKFNFNIFNRKKSRETKIEPALPGSDRHDQTLGQLGVETVSHDRHLMNKEKVRLCEETARAYVQKELAEARMMPAEAEAFGAAFYQSLLSDEFMPLSDGTKRADRLKSMQATRRAHYFFLEMVGPEATARILKDSTALKVIS
jgi:hypothetical protein